MTNKKKTTQKQKENLFLQRLFFSSIAFFGTGENSILIETPMEPSTVTPIRERRRAQLSARLVEINKEFEDPLCNNKYLTDSSS